MKKTMRLGLALGICLALAATVASFAQGQSNNKKENTEAKSNSDKQNAKKEEAQARHGNPQSKADKQNREKANGNRADKDNNGNAYGRNKGELSGREFGQARDAAAKRTPVEKQEHLNTVVTTGEQKAKEARNRIARALEALEQDRRTRNITDAEYTDRRARIARAEQAVKVLEEKVLAGKQLVVTIE